MRQEKETESVHICKEEIKPSLFTEDIIVYVENLKESKKKLLKQKLIVFLYTSDIHLEFEIKKTLFILAPKKIKCVSINLTKSAKSVWGQIQNSWKKSKI